MMSKYLNNLSDHP